MEKLASSSSSSNNNYNNNNNEDEIGVEGETWESTNGDHKHLPAPAFAASTGVPASSLAIQFNVKQEETEKTQSSRNGGVLNEDSKGNGIGGSHGLSNGGGKDLKSLAKVVNQLTAIRAKEQGDRGKLRRIEFRWQSFPVTLSRS